MTEPFNGSMLANDVKASQSVKVYSEIETANVIAGLKRVEGQIREGIEQGMEIVAKKTYAHALKRLKLFNHTNRKESLKGLGIKATKYNSFTGDREIEIVQKSYSGKVLEYKGIEPRKGTVFLKGSDKSGIISLSNPNQKRAHKWLREKGLKSAKLSFASQVSPIGTHSNIKPMQDAMEKEITDNDRGILTIAQEIINRIK